MKIGKKQVKILKENMDKLAKSDEAFILVVFKNKDGTDNITQYGYNFPEDKLVHYLEEAIKSRIKEDI